MAQLRCTVLKIGRLKHSRLPDNIMFGVVQGGVGGTGIAAPFSNHSSPSSPSMTPKTKSSARYSKHKQQHTALGSFRDDTRLIGLRYDQTVALEPPIPLLPPRSPLRPPPRASSFNLARGAALTPTSTPKSPVIVAPPARPPPPVEQHPALRTISTPRILSTDKRRDSVYASTISSHSYGAYAYAYYAADSSDEDEDEDEDPFVYENIDAASGVRPLQLQVNSTGSSVYSLDVHEEKVDQEQQKRDHIVQKDIQTVLQRDIVRRDIVQRDVAQRERRGPQAEGERGRQTGIDGEGSREAERVSEADSRPSEASLSLSPALSVSSTASPASPASPATPPPHFSKRFVRSFSLRSRSFHSSHSSHNSHGSHDSPNHNNSNSNIINNNNNHNKKTSSLSSSLSSSSTSSPSPSTSMKRLRKKSLAAGDGKKKTTDGGSGSAVQIGGGGNQRAERDNNKIIMGVGVGANTSTSTRLPASSLSSSSSHSSSSSTSSPLPRPHYPHPRRQTNPIHHTPATLATTAAATTAPHSTLSNGPGNAGPASPTISTNIPCGSFFEEDDLSKISFSIRGSLIFGGKRPWKTSGSTSSSSLKMAERDVIPEQSITHTHTHARVFPLVPTAASKKDHASPAPAPARPPREDDMGVAAMIQKPFQLPDSPRLHQHAQHDVLLDNASASASASHKPPPSIRVISAEAEKESQKAKRPKTWTPYSNAVGYYVLASATR